MDCCTASSQQVFADKICDWSLVLVQCEVGVVVRWKKLFFIGGFSMSWKSLSFSPTKSFPFTESFTLCSQKPLVFATETPLVRTTFYCPQKLPFLRTKSLSFAQAVPCLFQKPHIFTNQKFFFCTNLFYCHQKQSFSTLHLPFAQPLTYCLQRIQPFFWCSLNSLRCKAGASHRFKSLPAIPGEVAAFRKTGYLMMAGCFSGNYVSTGDLNRPRSPERFANLWRAFWFFLHDAKRM